MRQYIECWRMGRASGTAKPTFAIMNRKSHYRRAVPFVQISVLMVCLFAFALAAPSEEWRFTGVKRVVAISDVHGAYDDMVLTLQSSGILDKALAWSGGNSHLVLTGDMLDRGADSRKVMDLMMRLELEAIQSGGQVHVLLGNHEIMNLIGDLRYVADSEYAAFSQEESATDRKLWFQRFVERASTEADIGQLFSEYSSKAPPGFFAHRRAFRAEGKYGRWLLQKPLMVVINETAYVHGGLPEYVAKKGMKGVNDSLKNDVVDFLEIRSRLEDARILSPLDGFQDLELILNQSVEGNSLTDEQVHLVRKLISLGDSPVHRSHGPLWYRGSSYCSALIESDGLGAALKKIGADRVVIGHSTTASRRVQQRLDGRVIEINTGMLKSSYGGNGYALIIDSGEISVVGQNGERGLVPVVLPRRVGYESTAFNDEQIAALLLNGKIDGSPSGERSRRLIRVDSGGESLVAQFSPARSDTNYAPELAAFRLDRMLQLEMIPVTVRRAVDGRPGTLQFVPKNLISERERFAVDDEGSTPCSLEKQRSAMQVFDALIDNVDRSPLSILYSRDTQKFVLTGHENAFSSDSSLSGSLRAENSLIGESWRQALGSMSDEDLRQLLQDTLDQPQLDALVYRRGLLLQ